MNCDQALELITFQAKRAIKAARESNLEHAFMFSPHELGEITRGEANTVQPAALREQIGSFHVHTLVNSSPSVLDIEAFKGDRLQFLCYAYPTEDTMEEWKIRCYDEEISPCANQEIYL